MAFRVGDLYLPAPEEVSAAFSAISELEGTVIDFSDAGGASGVFGVVRVIKEFTVVVPVEKLRLIEESGVSEPPLG